MSERTRYRRLREQRGPRKARTSECVICHVVFPYKRSATCSRACFRRHQSLIQRPEISRTCPICKKAFVLGKHRGKKACSPKCRGRLVSLSHSKRPRRPVPSRTCSICRAVFAPTNYSTRSTCSQTCLGEAIRRSKQSEPVERACAVCGAMFQLNAQQVQDDKKTCSQQCFSLFRSQVQGGKGEGTCEICGRKYRTSRYHVRHGRRFCGDECRLKWFTATYQSFMTGEGNPFWRGGLPENDYGPSWRKAKRLARQRAGYTCEECGKRQTGLRHALSVHHIKPFRLFGTARHLEANQQENLRCLCRSCHTKVEWRDYQRQCRADLRAARKDARRAANL